MPNHREYGWPRMMLKVTAAAYLGMGTVALKREVFSGNLPQPTMLGGRKRRDRHEIDVYLDRETGDGYDWREHQPGLQRDYGSSDAAR